MSETRLPYGTQQEPATLTDADLADIRTRLYGGDAEGVPAHLAELLFVDLPRLLEEVERVRGLFPDPEADAEAAEDIACCPYHTDWGDGLARRLRQVRGEGAGGRHA